jgi:ABC-type microcin C transport system permease subunit YejB
MDFTGTTTVVKVGNWLLGSVIVLWIVTVVVLGAATYVSKFSLRSSLSDSQRTQAAGKEIVFAVVLVALPALAAVLAAATRRTGATIILLVTTTVLIMPAVYVGRVGINDRRAGQHITPEPDVTQCIPRSGSTHSCPGG